jgi:Flp pilus assembly protein TadG
MKLRDFIHRRDGSTAVEFTLVGPLFIGVMVGIFQAAMVLWTQLGMEHAVEAAARCSAVNSSTCGSATQVQSYAATQAYGLKLPSSVFSFTPAPTNNTCTASTTCCGNVVSASYTYPFFSQVFHKASVALTAQSCFPTP